MTHLLGQVALLAATLFAGAAVYVSFAEHPARMHLDPMAALRQWKPSYLAATKMQASLAALSGVARLVVVLASGDARWLIGAVLILANLPYTLLRMLPTNKALQAIPDKEAGTTSTTLLRRWARMHLVRSGLGLAAMLAYAWAAG